MATVTSSATRCGTAGGAGSRLPTIIETKPAPYPRGLFPSQVPTSWWAHGPHCLESSGYPRQPAYDFLLGRPLRLVSANSSSCFSLIDSYISREAPLSSLFLISPRLAASAAPAAFC